MSAIKKFAGQTAIYGFSTIFSKLLNFLLTPLYTKVYPATVYGILTTIYAWVAVLNAILAFGMETTFFRYLNKVGQDREKVYANTFITVAFITAVFLTGILLFSNQIAVWMQTGESTVADYSRYVKYFAFILAADALAVVPFAKVRADERPMRFGMIKTINILVSISLNLFFLLLIPYILKNNLAGAEFFRPWYRPGWVGYVFISNLVASIITLVLLLPELLQLKLRLDMPLIKEMLLYSFPILAANISFIINETSDKIFLGRLLPENISELHVGIYGACAKLAIFLNLFVQAFRLGAEPFFFSQAEKKNSGETYARIMNYFVIVVSVIFVGLSANIEILKYFIGSSSNPEQQAVYWSGLDVVPILLFGYACLGIYMNLSIWYKLSDQTRYGLYISGIGAVLTIILNIIFIPKYSYMASAWISLAAYAVMMILSYNLGQKNYPIPYNLKKNLAYLLSSIVLVTLSFTIFNRNLIIGNLLFVVYAAAILYFERKELKLLLGK